MSKIKAFAIKHKIISAIIVIAVVWGGYTVYAAVNKPAAVTKYVVQAATQGTVISSVSGSGQVQADTTVDVKPQTSENVTQIYVTPGEHVTTGQLLVQLDTTNEQQSVTQAQLSLQSAQLALAKLEEVATTSVLQDQSGIVSAQDNVANASTSLAKDYQNSFDTIASTFIDLQNIMTNLEDFVGGTQVDKVHDNPDAYVDLMPAYLQPTTEPYATAVEADYQGAVTIYEQNLNDYHAVTPSSTPATISALLAETQNTVQTIAAAVKSVNDLLNYAVNNYPTSQGLGNLPTITTTYQTDFGNYTNTVNTDLNNITTAITNITNDEQAITNDQLALTQASDSYTELIGGPDPLDVQSQNISIENAQLSLQTAQQNLAYDSIRAPIAGVVASVPAIIGETVPSPAVTIVSDGQLAEITLNEIDAAKVQLGNTATLTFDALPDLSLAGTVTEIDPVGTVSAGVVNYNVQINFTQPANTSSTAMVKPGMSVTAAIDTQVDQNTIAVPNAAVHTSGTTSYVLEPATPLSASDLAASASGGIVLPGGTKMVPVTVGISNDTQTEIDSGVNVGDQIITQTIQSTASTASTASTGGTSALRALTGGGGGGTFTGGAGGGFRAGGGG
jgi:multidrug efflux pump subunit AcrA (membrane-fusion protein)